MGAQAGSRGVGLELALAACLSALAVVPQPARAQGSAYDDVVAWMSHEKSASGFLPGATEMMDKMGELGARMNTEERSKLWYAWMSGQRPPVSGKAIAERVRAKRSAIETIRLGFSVREEAGSAGHMQLVGQGEHSFLSKDDKLRMSRQQSGDQVVRAYDGERERTLVAGTSERPPHGMVRMRWSRAQYFTPANPLALQMLLDTRTDLGSSWAVYDLVEFLSSPAACVLEKPDTVDGRKAVVCILGAPATFMAWLDPDHNYAVLRFQTNRFMEDADGVFTGAKQKDMREATDFVDCGNGIWLPGKVVLESRDGDVLTRTVVTVDEMAVNEPIDDSAFVDVFPAGTPVQDTVDRKFYIAGDLAEAGSAPSEAAESPKQAPQQSEAKSPEAGAGSAPGPGRSGQRAALYWLYAGACIAVAGGLVALLMVIKRRTAVGQ